MASDNPNNVDSKLKDENDAAVETTAFVNDHHVIGLEKDENHVLDVAFESPEGEPEEKGEEEEDRDDWDDDLNTANENQDSRQGLIVLAISSFQRLVLEGLRLMRKYKIMPLLCLLLYTAYFIQAMRYKFGDDGSLRLVVCSILAVVIYTRCYWMRGGLLLYNKTFGERRLNPKVSLRLRLVVRWAFYLALLAFAIWVIIDNADKTDNIRALPGIFISVIICMFFSKNPRKINWHTVIWGLGVQFLFAVCTLKFKFGQDVVQYVQERLDEFFALSKVPTMWLFGPETHQHQILLEAFPIVIMISATIALLYYFGVMQFVIKVIGSILSFILDTEIVESMSVASGIFLDGVMAIIALRPYMEYQSKSQMFTILTSVFSSLGGIYLAILAKFQIPLSNILPAMLISAPATFAVCKLIVPETRPKNSKRNKIVAVQEETEKTNMIDAFQAGAMLALPLIGNLIAIPYAFIAGLTWINNTTQWFGDRIGQKNFTLEFVMSYLLYPVALAMGVHPDECRLVARLLGVRFLSSNFVSFLNMMPLIGNRHMYNAYMAATNSTGSVVHRGDDLFLVQFNQTLTGGIISERAQAITTYSLCGFSSILSMALILATFYTLVPKRRLWLSEIAIPALIAGNIANCMTACFAGKISVLGLIAVVHLTVIFPAGLIMMGTE